MKEKSSIEWLITQIQFYIDNKEKLDRLKSTALEMHKSEILNAYRADLYPCSDEDAEQFYNQFY